MEQQFADGPGAVGVPETVQDAGAGVLVGEREFGGTRLPQQQPGGGSGNGDVQRHPQFLEVGEHVGELCLGDVLRGDGVDGTVQLRVDDSPVVDVGEVVDSDPREVLRAGSQAAASDAGGRRGEG